MHFYKHYMMASQGRPVCDKTNVTFYTMSECAEKAEKVVPLKLIFLIFHAQIVNDNGKKVRGVDIKMCSGTETS
jgi:hypothetical protein